MPRYEFKDDKSSKFWQITLTGDEVTTQWGRIGTDGQSKTKAFGDPATAEKEYDKQIKSKTKKGYELVEGGDDDAAPAASAPAAQNSASNPDLEAAIRATPDDPSVYQVYGDWLQAQGDPLGESVALHMAIAEAGDSWLSEGSDLRKALEALFKANTEHFFGPAHEDADDKALTFGEWTSYGKPRSWPDHSWGYGFARSTWRFGFMHGLHYDTGYYDDQDERGSDIAAKPLAAMLAAPGARFVREIDIGELWADYSSGEGPEMGYAIEAITAAPCAPMLRRLDFNGGEHDVNGVSLDATGLAKACPNLEELTLYAGQLTVGELDFPRMKKFAAQTGGLDATDMKAICAAKMPVIEELEVWFGADEYGANCSISDVAPLLEKKMPSLKRLGLMNSEFGDDICKAVVASPLLPQLEKLDLSMGIVTDEGAKALIDAAPKLAHLEHLAVRGYFSDDVAAALGKLAKERSIEVEGPPDDDYRYVEVGE